MVIPWYLDYLTHFGAYVVVAWSAYILSRQAEQRRQKTMRTSTVSNLEVTKTTSEEEVYLDRRALLTLTLPMAFAFWVSAAYMWFEVGWTDAAFLIVGLSVTGIIVPSLFAWPRLTAWVPRLFPWVPHRRIEMDSSPSLAWKQRAQSVSRSKSIDA